MKRALFILALSSATFLAVATPSQARTQSPERTAIEQAVVQSGFAASQIESVQLAPVRSGGEANSIRGYNAWVKVSGCERSIIVSTGRHGGVTNVHVPSACRS